MTSVAVVRPRSGGWLPRFRAGLSAVLVKELRSRMRGRRAFVIVTVYVAVLALFAWMALTIFQARAEQMAGSTIVSSQIGQQLFAALLLVETLLVLFLAPALTASAISLEREKQTLDMLVATPISALGLVLGKLLAALTYVFLLLLASVPLTALVFVFGGIGYADLIIGYVALIVAAIGFGSVGLFFSALVQRTQAATVLTYVVVFALTAGALFIWIFWRIVSFSATLDQAGNPGAPLVAERGRPPEALLYFNPFVSQAEIIRDAEAGTGAFCGFMSDAGLGAYCSLMNQLAPPSFGGGVRAVPAVGQARLPLLADDAIPGQNADPLTRNADLADVAPAPQLTLGTATFWPRATLAWIGLSVVLIGLSVWLVTPGRRLFRRRSRKRVEAAP